MKKHLFRNGIFMALFVCLMLYNLVWVRAESEQPAPCTENVAETEEMTGAEDVDETEESTGMDETDESEELTGTNEADKAEDSAGTEESVKPENVIGAETLGDTEEAVKETPEEVVDETTETSAKDTVGWITENGSLKYKNQDGTYVKSQWKKIGKYWFLFNKEGTVMTGWQEVNGQTYYLKKTGASGIKGAMLRGWQSIGGKMYYFKQSGSKEGAMFKGFQNIGKYRYYFSATGSYGEKGVLKAGWQTINGNTYYFKKTGEKGVKGRMFVGWQTLAGKTYYFMKTGDSKGKMLKGWQSIGGKKFFFKRTGEPGVVGQMYTGWKTIDGSKYFFKRTGAYGVKGVRFHGWQMIDGTRCFFDTKGVYIPGKKAYLVAIDAGHQLHGNSETEPNGPGSSVYKAKVTSGTAGKWSGLDEYELNLIVAKKLEQELKNRGYDVYMVRTTHNVNISNSQRAKMAANAGADIFIRIHANSDSNSSVYGALTIAPTDSNSYLTKANITASKKLSQTVLDGFCAATGAKNRSIWYTDTMSGINWSTIPVTIVEMGFMSNREEDLRMAQDAYQNKMAKGMADGIDNYFK